MSPHRRPHVLILGLGDTGLLCATRLSRFADVTGVSTKACMVSGQELGLRLARPETWLPMSMIGFHRYRRLDGVNIVHGKAVRVAPADKTVEVQRADGHTQTLSYDVLLIATGARNGFWRNDTVSSAAEVRAQIQGQAAAIAAANPLAIVGGGPSAVSTASNLKRVYPDKAVHLFFSRDHVLPGYHDATRMDVTKRLQADGVILHPNHRAEVAPDFQGDRFTSGPLTWQTGQPPFAAELVVWAIGRVTPHSAFLPPDMRNDAGFVRVDPYLRVEGYPDIFAIGDVAQTDPNRSSARNGGYETVARNIRKTLQGRPHQLKKFKVPPPYRWGSIFGVQREGLRVYSPSGRGFNMGLWLTTWVIFRWITAEIIYKGIRNWDSRGFRNAP